MEITIFYMKRSLTLISFFGAMLGLSPDAHAQSVVENDYFVVNFVNQDGWGSYSGDQQIADITAGVQGAIDYWGSLLGDNHKPLTLDPPAPPAGLGIESIAPWERRVVINFTFGGTFALASTGVATMDYENDDYPNPTLTTANGTSYNSVSRAELKLKTGYNYPLSLVSDDIHDMTINFSDAHNFSFNEAGTLGAYDFQTIFLHEMTHGMGFESDAYGVSGYNDGSKKTALDASMGTTIGQQELTVTTKAADGSLVEVAVLHNPTGEFQQGEHVVHIADDNALMRYSMSDSDPVQREFTDIDLAVLEAMGWNLTVPEAPEAPAEITLAADSLSRRPFTTEGGVGGSDVFSLTGISIADGKLNGSLTLELIMTSEQLGIFQKAYGANSIIGFELAGISLSEFWSSGINYNNITLLIGGQNYQVLGVSSVAPFGGGAANLLFYIPEPSTATLSLLALAGLVARRRRKSQA